MTDARADSLHDRSHGGATLPRLGAELYGRDDDGSGGRADGGNRLGQRHGWRAALQRLGVPSVDADQLAREVVAPGSEGCAKSSRGFGPEVLLPDGSLDRKALGAAGVPGRGPAGQAQRDHPSADRRTGGRTDARALAETAGAPTLSTRLR